MRLDRGLAVGSSGGHGPIRYQVEEYEPGRIVVFRFAPGMGIVGTHRSTVEANTVGTTTARHELDGEIRGSMRLVWPLVVRWLHDATVEDAFANMEAALNSQPTPARRHSVAVRFLRSLMAPSPAASSRRVAGDATAAALLGIGGLHAAWGLGFTWPGTDAASLASKVIGGTNLATPAECFVVAGLLATASGFIHARTRPTGRLGRVIHAPIPALGVCSIGGVLALRGALGWIGSASNLLRTTSKFRRNNLVLYSPLCLALAAGAFWANGVSGQARPTLP